MSVYMYKDSKRVKVLLENMEQRKPFFFFFFFFVLGNMVTELFMYAEQGKRASWKNLGEVGGGGAEG